MATVSITKRLKQLEQTKATERITVKKNAKAKSKSKQSKQSKQMTDYFPIRRSIRKTKRTVEQENLRYLEKMIEKKSQDGLVVKIFKEKGRGVVADRPFARGEFVIEYVGDLIDQEEAEQREALYSHDVKFGCYMYYFKHKEQQWW